jgi:hypothetical protein
MLLVDPGISLIGSGDCPGRGHANAPGARPNGRNTGSRGNPYLSALNLLNKQDPKQAPPITAQELQCLLSPPQSGSDQPLKPLQICWSPDQIRTEGMKDAGLCQGISDDAELEDCIQQNFGTAVLAVLPELSLYCYGGPDYGADSECVKRKFLKAWDDFHNNEFDIWKGLAFDDSRRHPTSRGPCAIVPPPDPATWTTPGAAACAAKKPSIRQKIRDALQRCRLDPACSGSNADNDDTPVASNNPPQDNTQAAPPGPPPLPKENEAWCNFMADAHRRGDLLGVPIPDECPREKTAYDKPPDGPLFAMSPVDTDNRIKDLEDEWCNDADNHCPWRKPPSPQPMERK